MKTIDILGLNKNTINIIKSQRNNFYFDTSILDDLEKFSLIDTPKKERKRISKLIRKNNSYIYDYKFKSIEFGILSDYFHNDIEVQKLLTYNRYGKCHLGSLWLITQPKFEDAKIVCGYIYSGYKKYFHSFVELDDYVFDYTKNLRLKKEDYYNLTNFEVLNELIYDEAIKVLNYSFIPIGLYFLYNREIEAEMALKKVR